LEKPAVKELSRRKFIVVSTLAAGFALAVPPISAQVITENNGFKAPSFQDGFFR
jgi:hypothetical protein